MQTLSQEVFEVVKNEHTFAIRMKEAYAMLLDEVQTLFIKAKFDFNGKRLISDIKPNVVLQWTVTGGEEPGNMEGSPDRGYTRILVYTQEQDYSPEELMPMDFHHIGKIQKDEFLK